VAPIEARVRTLIRGVLAELHDDTAVVMADEAVARNREVILHVTDASGEVQSWSARVSDCEPVVDERATHFRVRLSLLGESAPWPAAEQVTE